MTDTDSHDSPDWTLTDQRRAPVLRGARQRRAHPLHPRRRRHERSHGPSAVEKLARLGRVIAYDRRGCARSERPEPYERTSVAEHADDAAALLDALGGRAGGGHRPQLRRHRGDRSRAALPRSRARARRCSRATRRASSRRRSPPGWIALAERLLAVAAQAGVDAVAKALISEVAGESAWRRVPGGDPAAPGVRTARRSSPSCRASGGWTRTPPRSPPSDQPTLLVAAADSPPEFREPVEALAASLPNARTALVGGGHLIDPAAPEVLAFIEEVLGQP